MKLTEVLFSLLKYELFDIAPSKDVIGLMDEEALEEIYKISKKHDIANLIGGALERLEVSEFDIIKSFQKEQLLAVFRYEQSVFTFNEAIEVLSQNEISFIPLKGLVIRDYYKNPWMRTSCDLDILVHKEDLEKAKDLFVKKGYMVKSNGNHDISLISKKGVNLELHYSLIEENVLIKADKPLEKVWEYAKKSDKTPYRYDLDSEMLYYYHVAHMAKHFVNGGSGIRTFIDAFILNRTLKADEKIKHDLLKDGGLLKFYEEANLLSEVWFGESPHTDLTKNMENYILRGGIYGSWENNIIVGKNKKGSNLKYSVSKVWVPYDILKRKYSEVDGKKWLIPLFQAKRWIRVIFEGRLKRSVEMNIKEVPKDKAEEVKILLKELEI